MASEFFITISIDGLVDFFFIIIELNIDTFFRQKDSCHLFKF